MSEELKICANCKYWEFGINKYGYRIGFCKCTPDTPVMQHDIQTCLCWNKIAEVSNE